MLQKDMLELLWALESTDRPHTSIYQPVNSGKFLIYVALVILTFTNQVEGMISKKLSVKMPSILKT